MTQIPLFDKKAPDLSGDLEGWRGIIYECHTRIDDLDGDYAPLFFHAEIRCRRGLLNPGEEINRKHIPGYISEILLPVTRSPDADIDPESIEDFLYFHERFPVDQFPKAVSQYLTFLKTIKHWEMISRSRITAVNEGIEAFLECIQCGYMSQEPEMPCPGCEPYELKLEDFGRWL